MTCSQNGTTSEPLGKLREHLYQLSGALAQKTTATHSTARARGRPRRRVSSLRQWAEAEASSAAYG